MKNPDETALGQRPLARIQDCPFSIQHSTLAIRASGAHMHPGYFPVFFWSLLIFFSFWGYGELLRRRIDRPEFADIGRGLTVAWGMSVVLAIGGVLMALHVAKAPVLTIVVLAGAALAVFYLVGKITTKDTKPTKGSKSGKKASISDSFILHPLSFILYFLALLAFASSIAWPFQIDPNDDLVCYLMLPQKILQTGTLIEPFSFQRAGTFGGQAILQALVMIVGNEVNGYVPDRGFAMVIVFGILLGVLRGMKGQYAIVGFLLMFTFWYMPVPRISTHGAMTGGCLLIALLDALGRMQTAGAAKDARQAIPAAFLAAGACSIRPTFTIVIGAVFAALAIQSAFFQKKKAERILELASLVKTGILCAVLLVPFMIVLYQSNGTPMIPPFSGYVSKVYQGMYGYPVFSQNLTALLAFIAAPQTIGLLIVLVLPVFLPGVENRRWVIGATIIACAVMVVRFGALAYLDLYRYLYPIILPVAFWYLAFAIKFAATKILPKSKAAAIQLPSAFTAAACVILMVINFQQANAEIVAQVTSTKQQMGGLRTFLDPRLKECYKTIQDAVPPGAKVLTMVDASYWLDYARNPMYSLNIVGGSSPPPGLPFFQGSNALRDYLKSQGIRYVIAVQFDNAVLLYTRSLWTERTRPEWFYSQIWRPRFLDMMNSIDDWDREGKVISRAGNLRLFDLGSG